MIGPFLRCQSIVLDNLFEVSKIHKVPGESDLEDKEPVNQKYLEYKEPENQKIPGVQRTREPKIPGLPIEPEIQIV